MKELILILINILLISSGQLLLKKSSLVTINEGIYNKIFNKYFIIGLFLYGLSTLLWIKILEKIDIGVAYPMMGFSYVVVFIGGYLFFQENINIYKIIGTICIIIGISLISK